MHRAPRIVVIRTSSVITKGRLSWFGCVECKDITGWIKHCTVINVEGIITWMEHQEKMLWFGICRVRKFRWQAANPSSYIKWL